MLLSTRSQSHWRAQWDIYILVLADGEKFIYGVSAILQQIKEGKFSYGNYSQKKIKHQ